MALFLVGSKTLVDPHETHPRLDGSQLPAVEACNMALILTTFPLDEVLPLPLTPKKNTFLRKKEESLGFWGLESQHIPSIWTRPRFVCVEYSGLGIN